MCFCKGEDVSKWNDCWGRIVVDHTCDPKKWYLVQGLYTMVKNMVFFIRSTRRSDGIFYAGNLEMEGWLGVIMHKRVIFKLVIISEGKPEGV